MFRRKRLAFGFCFYWILALGSASAAYTAEPSLPALFEDSGRGWLTRGPGYDFVVSGAGATLKLSDQSGRKSFLRMTVVGAHRSARAVPEDSSISHRNYLIGPDASRWRRNVPAWSRVRVSSVLPGVDLIYHGAGRSIEYDVIVAPGADPRSIRIRYTGARSMAMDGDGSVVFQGLGMELRQHKPTAYQEIRGVRRIVPASFRLDHGAVAFEIGEFDPAHTLVIDPVIEYATFLGGAQGDPILAMATDASGALYLAGTTGTPTIPVTRGAYQTSCGSDGLCDSSTSAIAINADVYVAKFSSDGSTLEYATYLGGTGGDIPRSIAVDSGGNLYVGGFSSSADFPITSDVFPRAFAPRTVVSSPS